MHVAAHLWLLMLELLRFRKPGWLFASPAGGAEAVITLGSSIAENAHARL